jgi:hypothetical protein
MANLLAKVGREFHRLIKKLKPKARTSEEKYLEWSDTHQPFELRFHQGENYRWNDATFFGQWEEVFGRFLELKPDQFGQGKVLLDVGCGSRPVLDWFRSPCEKHFLDPLLAQYTQIEKMRPYWDRKPAATLHSQPAEKACEALLGKCDFVNCWNVLDHTYDWRLILNNLRDYAKPGAIVCLGTDFQSHGDGHPGIEDRKYFDDFIAAHFSVAKTATNYVHREVALKLIRKP